MPTHYGEWPRDETKTHYTNAYRFLCPKCGEPAFIRPYDDGYTIDVYLVCPDCEIDGWETI